MIPILPSKLTRRTNLLISFFILASVAAGQARVNGDSLSINDRDTNDDPLGSAAVVLNEDNLADMDIEEFGDWIAPLPGFYPLDQAGFAQPFRGQFMGLAPWTIKTRFRGREVQDRLLGAPELGWIPPESLNRVTYDPLSLDCAGARIDADLRSLRPVPPSSRIATRDGFYGLGTVDFDLAEKISHALSLDGGGRVATFNGRLAHSEGYGLNLRAEVVWWDSASAHIDSTGLWGWWGIMQTRRNAQVPFVPANHNMERYESDAVLHWRRFTLRGYGVQQRETYAAGDADSWDELGLIAEKSWGDDKLGSQFQLNSAMARWRLKTMDWSATSFGGAEARWNWRPLKALSFGALLGLQVCGDFDPERHLGLEAEANVLPWAALLIGASQHQRQPSRFESAADFEPGTHYLIYDPVFFQYPEAPVLGASDLDNETYTKFFAGSQFHALRIIGSLAYVAYNVEKPISWRLDGDRIQAYNAPTESDAGALATFIFKPHADIEIGTNGSYLPLDSGQRRLFPEFMYHVWAQYRELLFNDNLDLRLRVFEDFWGQRWLPVSGGWEKEDESHVLSARIGARLYGVRLYYGVNNILSTHYDLLTGFPMAHKEEVWGISWNFTN